MSAESSSYREESATVELGTVSIEKVAISERSERSFDRDDSRSFKRAKGSHDEESEQEMEDKFAGQLPGLDSESESESGSGDDDDNNNDILNGLTESSSLKNSVFLASEDFYENEDEDEDEDLEGHDSEQEEFLYEAVIEQMQESVRESDQSIELVTPAQANEIRLSLLSQGPHKFMATNSAAVDAKYTNQQLVAGLGFNITTDDLSESHWMMYLFAAMRYATVKQRNRLDNPSNMDEFIKVLDKSQRVLVVTGAGISTSLNIPDFRSSRGIYKQIEHMGLSDPQEVFDLSLFSHDPQPFYTVAHRILYDSDVYTPTHGFIKMLEDKGKLLRNYTQNIEDLEFKAGISRDKIVQCHGSFAGATCTKCGYKVPGTAIFPDIRAQRVARCTECTKSYNRTKLHNPKLANNINNQKYNSSDDDDDDDDDEDEYAHIGVMKPDIVFFGEPLPRRFHDLIVQDVLDCDLLICMGTSLQVAPVCDIPRYVPANVPQVYVSLQPAKRFNFDITFLGKCDDVVEMFINNLEWKMVHSMMKGKFPGHLETDENRRYVIFREAKPEEGDNNENNNSNDNSDDYDDDNHAELVIDDRKSDFEDNTPSM